LVLVHSVFRHHYDFYLLETGKLLRVSPDILLWLRLTCSCKTLSNDTETSRYSGFTSGIILLGHNVTRRLQCLSTTSGSSKHNVQTTTTTI